MIGRTYKDLKKYLPYSIKVAQCELKAEVAESYLNWLWWILNPLCFMLLYAFVFGYVFNAREEYFPIFIFIGISVWDFFKNTITKSVKLVKSNKPIISRVYIPKYILILTQLFINSFKMAISFCIVFVMMLAFKVEISLNVFYIIPSLIALFFVTFGIACFVMHLGVFVADMSNVIGLSLRMMIYITGVFYNVEKRIPVYGKAMNTYNPIACIISGVRNCLLYKNQPNIKAILIWMVVGILISGFGIAKIYKEENGYVKVI